MQSRLCFSLAARRLRYTHIYPTSIFRRRFSSNHLLRNSNLASQLKQNVVPEAASSNTGSLKEEPKGPIDHLPSDQFLVPPTRFKKLTRIRYLKPRQSKKEESTPLKLLGHYLDAKNTQNARRLHKIEVHAPHYRISPPLVLLRYLMNQLDKKSDRIGISQDQYDQYLKSRSWKDEDVELWANILSGDDPDEMARRFCSASFRMPLFVLLEILRKDFVQVDSLSNILTWLTRMISPQPSSHTKYHDEIGLAEVDDTRNLLTTFSLFPEEKNISFNASWSIQQLQLEPNGFDLLISRLIHQARHIKPSAFVEISKLFYSSMLELVVHKSMNPENLDNIHLGQFCKLLNETMRKFARPAYLEPYKSMIYNWDAQRILLILAKKFEPSLILDQGSYRAIIQVLAALKKTEVESKSASLRAPSWPPWRVHQDGMDAQRSYEEDWSRVVRAVLRLKEAGYGGGWYEEALKVIGGQDFDGTPTIQQRKILKSPPEKSKIISDFTTHPTYWYARIVTTRNIQESWEAFLEFKKHGGIPNKKIYLAIFERLVYDEERLGRKDNYKYEASPGDGKEVYSIPDNNFSEDYKLHHQAPNVEILYKEMLQAGVRPSRQLLILLLPRARTLDDGFRYLDDSNLPTELVRYLRSTSELPLDAKILKGFSNRLLACFISFLRRFVPRAHYGVLEGSSIKEWIIIENSQSRAYKNGLHQPIQKALALLHAAQPRYKPAWYSLFKCLSIENVVISRGLAGHPENQFLAWQILVAALDDFHHLGLELDPFGFLLICQGFQAYASASYISEKTRLEAAEASNILKTEFRKLTRTVDESQHSKLRHTVRPVHLHNYIRCLGLVGDNEEIIITLKWMMEHHEELKMNSLQDRNGFEQLRKTLIAVRFFCSGTNSLSTAYDLVESVDSWNGWPKDDEVERYLQWASKPNE